MKIGGRQISGSNEEIIILPRGGENEDIVFKARAILDFKPFEDLVAEPIPPSKLMKGGRKVPDTDNRTYKAAVEDYGKKRMAWMMITSLSATPGLEWDTVDFDVPDSWANYQNDFRASGLSNIEIARIMQGVLAANSLDESKLEAARERFLATQEQVDQSSSHQEEQQIMPSGEPVKELVSDHQE